MQKHAAQDRNNVRTLKASDVEPVDRYHAGWRAGKPVEDPEKLKRWGFITAKPSEYLVCIKDGKIDRKRSGQGARIFKWPWEAVAIVPTTLQKLEFVADQITRERVGVQVTGIAVYRVAEPEQAYRVLNFTYGERASEKLGHTLGEMFIGAARRLIANLTLDECLMKRKEALANFLMEEIAPVVGGRGATDDSTDQGWGVVIDTIEIQDVRILSGRVFEDLQAPYRAELATRAERADLERQREIAERRAESERRMSEAAIQTQRETRALHARAEAEAAEIEAAEALRADQAKARNAAEELARKEALARKRLEVEQEIALREAESAAAVARRKAELERERELFRIKHEEEQRKAQAQAELSAVQAKEAVALGEAESAAQLARRQAELELTRELARLRAEEETRRARAEAERGALAVEKELAEEAHQLEARRLEQERERRRFTLETEVSLREGQVRLEVEVRNLEATAKRVEAQVDAEHQRAVAEIEVLLNEGRALRDLVNQGLPQVANAFKQSFGSIQVTQLSGGEKGGSPFGLVADGFAQVLSVAKAFGLDPARLGREARSGGEHAAVDVSKTEST